MYRPGKTVRLHLLGGFYTSYFSNHPCLCSVVYLGKLSLGLEVMNSLQAEAKPAKPCCYYHGGILNQ